VRGLLLIVCSLCASLALAEHPPDPFAGEYRLPQKRELGTAAGQFRILGSGTLGLGGKGPEVGLTGTLELMTFAYLGLRGTLAAPVYRPEHVPFVGAARVGPSLHLLPYRRVDLSVFCEGGAATVAPFTSKHTAMPMLSPGGTIEVWLDTWLLLRAEGRIDWGVYDAGRARTYLRFVGALGLGLAL
jgi:hypothetical protein